MYAERGVRARERVSVCVCVCVCWGLCAGAGPAGVRCVHVWGVTRSVGRWVMDNDSITAGRQVVDGNGAPLAPEITQTVGTYLSENNTFAQGFMNLNEQMATLEKDGELGNLKLVVHDERARPSTANHERNWTAPANDHGLTACVVHDGDDDLSAYGAHPLVVRARKDHGKLSYLHHTSQYRDPLRYPLLYPHGEPGYHPGLRKNNETAKYRRVSPSMYTRYHLHARVAAEDEKDSSTLVGDIRHRWSTLLRGGKLFQEKLLDSYLCCEADRLNWQKSNQKTIRAETYAGVQEAVLQATGATVGRRVVLAPSFTGGPRHYAQCFRDAMAIVRKHGRPDLFITFTCNPKWYVHCSLRAGVVCAARWNLLLSLPASPHRPEIKRELLPGQTVNDRPDLVARVFKLKLDELMQDVWGRACFGRVKAWVHTVRT